MSSPVKNPISRRWLVLIATASLGAIMATYAGLVGSRFSAAERWERESHFVAIHFAAVKASMAAEDGPRNLDELLKHSGGLDSPLMKPFPDGLVYRPRGDSFTLEEPKARPISLLRKDRLVGSDRWWPRWEASGEHARKFAEQEVPPNGFE